MCNQRKEEITETAKLIQVCILVLCFSNIYQMSTKKIFEFGRLAANNYVKKGRELHLNLTLNVKVTVKRPKTSHTRFAVDDQPDGVKSLQGIKMSNDIADWMWRFYFSAPTWAHSTGNVPR